MPRARKHLVCLSDTPYYLVTSRCVRRAFLCGIDKETGKSYEHRRDWIENRARVLSSLFSIHLCAYAVMSNHYHLVVKLNPDEAVDWTDDEVLERWTTLFRGPLIVQRYRHGESLSPAELDTLRDITAVFRKRLTSLSWFMKCLNEPIARMANAEDGCTGHFWEARFDSRALCSEPSLVAAMVYVDLNPIRAKIAETPEQSAFTSIRTRLVADTGPVLREAISAMLANGELNHFNAPVRPLMEFPDQDRTSAGDTLPIHELEYFRLVDITGRIVVRGKRGRIDPNLEPILSRLKLSSQQWIEVSTGFRKHYRKGQLRITRVA